MSLTCSDRLFMKEMYNYEACIVLYIYYSLKLNIHITTVLTILLYCSCGGTKVCASQ